MARGFPDYITRRVRGLKGDAFRNVTPDVEMTAEGRMPVQRHLSWYDLPGYLPGRAEYQGAMDYQEPAGCFEGLDRMLQAGSKFVREAGESFVQQFKRAEEDMAYQPEPLSQEVFQELMEQAIKDMRPDVDYQGDMGASGGMNGAVGPGGDELEIMAAVEEVVNGGGQGELSQLMQLPDEMVEVHDPGVGAGVMEDGGGIEELQGGAGEMGQPETLEDIVMQAMQEQPQPEEILQDPMQMFVPGMGPG